MQQAGCWGKNPPDYFNMKISFIYMASGYGRRFGSNKLYARLDGKDLGLEAVYNGFSSQGITASLRLGTKAAGEDTDILLFFVADQPYMKGTTVASFVRGFAGCGYGIGCVKSGDRKGNPAAFSGRYRQELLALWGDRGGSVIMKAHPGDVWTMEVPAEELKDIDLQEDLGQ